MQNPWLISFISNAAKFYPSNRIIDISNTIFSIVVEFHSHLVCIVYALVY